MKNKYTTTTLGIRIGINNLNINQKVNYLFAVNIVLDTAFGEKYISENIHHVEVAKLPEKPEKHGYIELKELSEYISWVNEKNT